MLWSREAAARALSDGWRVQHVADRVRLLALEGGGWFGEAWPNLFAQEEGEGVALRLKGRLTD